ncbi:MAG: ABC transporter permease [Bacteroidota bacterium]|nr:ABC transporter permease [Bacteroidota bacterium]
MLKNYITSAFRNLRNNKIFSFINILGLAIGISASMVIFLIIQFDLSFDHFEKNRDRIYRVVSVFNFSGEEYKNSGVPSPLGKTMATEITGLETAAHFRMWTENQTLSIPNPANTGKQPIPLKTDRKTIFADKHYFDVIPYQWLAGDPSTALNEPNQIVLTESTARQYFASLPLSDIMGKEILFDDSVRTTVSGIVADLTEHTDFNFTKFVSLVTLDQTSLKPSDWTSWGNTNGNSQQFVRLAPGTKPAQIEKQINQIYEKRNPKEAGDHTTHTFLLQPLSDLHFNTDFDNFNQRIAHKPTLYGLMAVALFLLLLGCINFINLTTANATQRAKEIGIRKTMGSSRKQLMLQFLCETVFITLIATILSIVLTPFLLHIFSDFIPKELQVSFLQQPQLIIFLLGLLLLVSFLAGFYPAWVLSSYQPVNVLKNQTHQNSGQTRKAWMRKSLTISQFVIAQFFILATMVVSKQISYTLSKDLGFKKDAILYFSTDYRDKDTSHKQLLAKKLAAIPEIARFSLSNGAPSSPGSWTSTINYKNGKKELSTDVELKFGDTGYIHLFHLQLLAGNNFVPSDTTNQFLINEAYAKVLGFRHPQDAIGKYLEWSNRQVYIAGVLADFHQKSLHEMIKPLVIGSWANTERTFCVQLQPRLSDGSNWKAGIAKIEKAWKEIYPREDFSYEFLDESIAKYYTAEKNISSLLRWATGLAILISCLGLLGLVIYTTHQRTKEIGIRKVLDASITQIVSILTKDFVWLVLIAFIIAAPIAWWAMYHWLQNFAYRTTISWWLFGAAGVMTISLAILTISLQTIRAARVNPVKSLRTE